MMYGGRKVREKGECGRGKERKREREKNAKV